MTHALRLRARTDAPTLWARAKAMFASLCDAFRLARDFAVSRPAATDRRRMLAGLKPIERIVRTLMIVDALTFLLMTPEGRRLRVDAQKIDPPAPPALSGFARPAATQVLRPPGWHTIAANRPFIDPRVVEREQREAMERRRSLEDQAAHALATLGEPDAARQLNAAFRILHWDHDLAPSPDAHPTTAAPRAIPHAYDPYYPILPSMLPPARISASDDANAECGLARRFAALAHILANPEAAIRRLARRLATLPLDCLPLLGPGRIRGTREGDVERVAAIRLGHRALSAYTCAERALTRPPDPG